MSDDIVQADRPRAEQRRDQVLAAAGRCFIRRGFHSTSIAQIGAEAGMSVGHIYRYFTNKEAIIAGIVRQRLDEGQAFINQIEAEADDLRAALIACTDRCVDMALDPSRAVLMIEVKAESARNPKLAEIMRAADAEMREHLRGVLSRASSGDWTESDVEMRAELLALLFEGLPLRTLANPDLDRQTLTRVMSHAVAGILGSKNSRTSPEMASRSP